MKRLLVDMDGVLADAYEQFAAYDERATGRRKTLGEAIGVPEFQVFEQAQEHICMPGFFRTMRIIPDGPSVLAELNRKYEVFIVSAATEFPLSMHEKIDWLAEHFPFISRSQVIFCGTKKAIKGDIMIDDFFRNLDPFEGRTLLFNQPHNQTADPKHHQRVHSWKEVAGLLF